MNALVRVAKRARAREGRSIHVGDVVLSLVTEYRLQGDIAVDPFELSSHLNGKDFDLNIADVESLPGGHQAAVKASRALNAVEWPSRRQSGDPAI